MKKYQFPLVAVAMVVLAGLIVASGASAIEGFHPAYIEQGSTTQGFTSFSASFDTQHWQILAGIAWVEGNTVFREMAELENGRYTAGVVPFKEENVIGVLLAATYHSEHQGSVMWAVMDERPSFLTTADGYTRPGLYVVLKLVTDGVTWDKASYQNLAVEIGGQDPVFTAHATIARMIKEYQQSGMTGVCFDISPHANVTGFTDEAIEEIKEAYADIVVTHAETFLDAAEIAARIDGVEFVLKKPADTYWVEEENGTIAKAHSSDAYHPASQKRLLQEITIKLGLGHIVQV